MKIKFVKDMHNTIPESSIFQGSNRMDSMFRRITPIYEYLGSKRLEVHENRNMPERSVLYALRNGYAKVILDESYFVKSSK